MILAVIVLYGVFINMYSAVEPGPGMSRPVAVVGLACRCNYGGYASYSPNNTYSSHWKLCLSQIDMEGYITDSRRVVTTYSVLKLLLLLNYQ